MTYTNFDHELDEGYEEAPETWLVQAVWITPAVLLVLYILYKLVS